MPANTQITGSLVMGEVPQDLECNTGSITEIGTALAQVMSISSSTPESPQSQTDSTAALALNTANQAISQVSALSAQIPQRRTGGTPQSVPVGDSDMSLNWSPAMPDSDYEVRGTFYGPAGLASITAGYYVVDGTQTVNGCTVRLCNIQANFKFSWVVEDR